MLVGSDLPQAMAFLANVLPWPEPGGQQFWINVHRRSPMADRENGAPRLDSKGKQLQAYGGKACKNVREAGNHIAWALGVEIDDYPVGKHPGTDIYVCMSGQSQALEAQNKVGKRTYRAVRSANNAVAFKGLWVDVDVKPKELEKGYATTEEAFAEFGRIRREIGLPAPSSIVYSGSGGFHAHFVFQQVVGLDTWEPLAHQLVAGLSAHGFRGDTGCTIDAVRLLRVPNTWNYKAVREGTGPAAPVVGVVPFTQAYDVQFIKDVLKKWEGVVLPGRISVTRPVQSQISGAPSQLLAQSSVDPTSLGGGVETTALVPIMKVAETCPFVHRSLATGGVGNNNPLWMITTRIAMFTHEGKDAAHWMAAGHPTYTPVETTDMYDRVVAEREVRDLGWPRCRTIAGQGAPECASCPHRAADKSPFNHIKPNAIEAALQMEAAPPQVDPAAVAAMEPLPVGYSYGPHGTILVNKVDNDGNAFKDPVSGAFPMLKPWIQDSPAELNFTTYTAGALGSNDTIMRQIKVPFEHLYEKATLGKTLASQHMTLPPRLIDPMGVFMLSWIETLRQDTNKVIQNAPFGWNRSKQGRITGFIFGNNLWSTKPPTPASNPDPQLNRYYSPTGELEPWKRAAKMITDQQRPELNAMLASAFAGPLVHMVGQTGLFMSTYSAASGIGKSTTLKVAQAVWGHPIKGVQSLSDTQNSVIKKLGDLRNLPAYWDELKTNEETERFVHLVFQLSQGKEKSRLTSDVAYREMGSWETILVSTSNDALMSHVTKATKSTSAGMARIFEFEIAPGQQGQISPAEAQQITAALADNYGQAGLLYAKWLGKHFEHIQKEMDACLRYFEDRYSAKSEERFWLALITTLVMGARYANHLGLTEIDENGMLAFLEQQFARMRDDRKEAPVDLNNANAVLGHLTRYLNTKAARNTIATNRIHTAAGRAPVPPHPNAILLKMTPGNHLQEVQVHVGVDTKQMRLIKAPFLQWLDEQGLSRSIILKQLMHVFLVKETRGRLGAGTPHSTQVENVLDFNYGDPVFRDFIDY